LLATGRELRAVSGLGEVRVVAWLGAGRTALAGNKEGIVSLLDLADGTVRAFAPVAAVWDLALSPNERRIAVATDQGARLADIVTKQWEKTFTLPTKPVRVVAFLEGGKQLLSCGEDGTIQRCDVVTGRPVGRVLSQASSIVCASVASDGHHAATGAVDGSIRLWDLQADRQRHAVLGHALPVHGVAFTPDARYILSGSLDKTARLWRIP
jgi:WD40 repeat protein